MSGQPELDFGNPVARSGDLDTAKGAAVIAIGRAAEHRRLALVTLYGAGDDGISDFKLADLTGVIQTSIGVRRGECVKAGLVERAETNDVSPSGSPCARWRITGAGRVLVESWRIAGAA